MIPKWMIVFITAAVAGIVGFTCGALLTRPDRDNFAPRREDYFTLRFGNVDIPMETVRMRVVLHVTRPGSSKSETAPDSAVWLMERVESELRGLMFFRDNVRGYE